MHGYRRGFTVWIYLFLLFRNIVKISIFVHWGTIMNLLLNFHLFPSSKSFNFHVPSILCCCFYETLEILFFFFFPTWETAMHYGNWSFRIYTMENTFPWKLKCLIGAPCFQGIQVIIANTMEILGNRKSPSWRLQKASISLLFMILSKYAWNKELQTVYSNLIYRYLDVSPSDIYSVLEKVLQRIPWFQSCMSKL